MVPELRRAYNAAFTPEKYEELQRYMERKLGYPVGFRLCETPLFLTRELTEEVVRAGWEIANAVTDPAFLAGTDRAIPPGLSVPNEDEHTTFLQVDLAIARDEEGRLPPRAVAPAGVPAP